MSMMIIDNYDSFTYNLVQGLSHFTDDIVVYRNDQISVDTIAEQNPQGIILSPGPKRPEDAGICIELIQRLSGQFPILGVCLGMQAIAQAFGGQVVKSSVLMHGQSSLVYHNRSALYDHMPLPFDAGRYHSLMVARDHLPELLTVDAQSADELVMGISHKEHPTFGVQFHPESILTEDGQTLLSTFLQFCQRSTAC